MRYFIHFSFNGSQYHGWQIQQNAPSVQGTIQRAMLTYLGSNFELTGCGRTDAGVHARDFYAHFDCSYKIDTALLAYKLNAILDYSIRIHSIFEVDENFHARFSAKEREYKYFVSTEKEPFASSYTYFHPRRLDIQAMNNAAKYLIGTHDFTSFAKLHSQTNNNICSVKSAFWEILPAPAQPIGSVLVFTISANRFLRNMVRAIVGTLLEIGEGKKPQEWILQVMEASSRCSAGASVAPHALFLWKIEYDF